MRAMLIAPPPLEPASLEEAKLYLRIDQDDEDDLVRTFLVAARLLVEAASGRMLIEQSWRIVLDAWPASGVLRLPVSPVHEVLAIRVFDGDGAATTLPNATLALETGADPPALWVERAPLLPGRPRSGIEIDLRCGFGPAASDVPAGLRQAILRLAARWHEERGDASSGPHAGLPADIMALIAPHRQVRL